MIFHKLVLENFGLYSGKQVLDLASNHGQPIILIGGMNGGGKTTLMDAIRLALYGYRAQCSSRNNLSYSNFLSQCVTHGSNGKIRDGKTSIELTIQDPFLVQDISASQSSEIKVRREWTTEPKNGRDTLSILVDNQLNENLTENWETRIEEVLPLGISKLFLFDGEQVKELAEQVEPTPMVIDAIRSLLGLELPERLSNDLSIIISRKVKSLRHIEDTQSLAETEDKKAALQKELSNLQRKITRATNKVEQTKANLISQGGKLVEKKAQWEAQIKQYQNSLALHQKELLSLAAGVLPLALIEPLLLEAKNQGEKEVAYQRYRNSQELLEQQQEKVVGFLESKSVSAKILQELQTFLNAEELEREKSLSDEVILKMDEENLSILKNIIYQVLPHSKDSAKNHKQALRQSQNKIKTIQNNLDSAPPEDVYQKLEQDYQKAQDLLIEHHRQAEENRQKLKNLQQEMQTKLQELVKIKIKENELKGSENQDVINAATKVQGILKVFANSLKQRKISQLELQVTEYFQFLLRKSDFVHSIKIDSETFALSLYDSTNNPIPRQRLSAGEKQMLAIAFLWGLASASGRKLPVAIDTPLGRLDSSHRNNLISSYFPHASHQVILLSTDTEIGKREVEQLRKNEVISQEYLLKYDLDQHQTQIVNGYFF